LNNLQNILHSDWRRVTRYSATFFWRRV